MDDHDGIVGPRALRVEGAALGDLADQVPRGRCRRVARRREDARGGHAGACALLQLGRDDDDLVGLGELVQGVETHPDAQPGALHLVFEAAEDLQPRGGELVARVRADDRSDEDPRVDLFGAQCR